MVKRAGHFYSVFGLKILDGLSIRRVVLWTWEELIDMVERKMDGGVSMQEVINAINAAAESQERNNKEQIEVAKKGNKLLVDAITKFGGRDGGHIGRVAEALVAGAVSDHVRRHFKINVKNSPRRRLKLYERQTGRLVSDIDVMVEGADAVVIVEVKATVTNFQIVDFSRILQGIVSGKYYARGKNPPRIGGKKVYGGVAFFGTRDDTDEEKVVKMAEDKGLFAMRILRRSNFESCNSHGFSPNESFAMKNLTKDE